VIEFCDSVEGGDSLNQTSGVNININLNDLGTRSSYFHSQTQDTRVYKNECLFSSLGVRVDCS
jgi:hypothetical protein